MKQMPRGSGTTISAEGTLLTSWNYEEVMVGSNLNQFLCLWVVLPLLLPLSFWACSPSAFYNPPLLFHPFPPSPLPRLMHTSRRDPFVPNSLLRWCHRYSSRRGQTTVQTTSGH